MDVVDEDARAEDEDEAEALVVRVAEVQPLSDDELEAILDALAITPTDVIRDPIAILREIQVAQGYRIESSGIRIHLGTKENIPGFEKTVLEEFLLPERTVINGNEQHLDMQTVYVVVHRIECQECAGQFRDSYLVAGLIFP